MKKVSSQSKRGRKKITDPVLLAKRQARQQIRYMLRYYPKTLMNHIENIETFFHNNHMSGSNRELHAMVRSLDNIMNNIRFVLDNNLESPEYANCIKEKFKHISEFMRDLKEYDYNLWAYYDNEGDNNPLVPRMIEAFTTSDKIYEKLFQGFENVLGMCNQHK